MSSLLGGQANPVRIVPSIGLGLLPSPKIKSTSHLSQLSAATLSWLQLKEDQSRDWRNG